MPIRPVVCALCLLTVLLGTLSPLGAEEPSAPLEDPQIAGLTVVVENVAPGFLSVTDDSQIPITNALYENFFVHITNLEAVKGRIKSVRVEDSTGRGWDIKPEKYIDLTKKVIGGWGRWYSVTDAAPRSFAVLDVTVKITTTDGKTVSKAVSVPPPPNLPLSVPPRFLVNSAFRGLRTPYEVSLPEPVKVKSLSAHDGSVWMDFAVEGVPTTNGQLNFYDASGEFVGWSPDFRGTDVPWLNGGRGWKSSGINHVEFPLSKIHWATGKDNAAVAGVSIVTKMEGPPDANLMRWPDVYVTRTGLLLLNSDGAPRLLRENIRARIEREAKAPPSPPFWDGSEKTAKLWEISLAGILSQINGYNSTQLLAFEPPKADAERAGLYSSWTITDRASLLNNMNRLLSAGHSARYSRIQSLLTTEPDTDSAALSKKFSDEGITAEGVDFVREFQGVTGANSLRAWDLTRLVYLARAGYALGWLTEDEAWAWLAKAGADLRGRYRSWAEFGSAYLVGRMFWGGTKDEVRLYLEGSRAMVALMKSGGPWATTPWPPRPEAESDAAEEAR